MNIIGITPGPSPMGEGRSSERDEALMKACKEFESIMTHELLKSMRRTVDKCDLFHGGQGEEIYESMLDQELSKGLAGKGDNSLALLLYGQLHVGEPEGGAQDGHCEGEEITGPSKTAPSRKPS